MEICIDARMIESSGIGTVIRNTIPFLPGFLKTLIVKPDYEKRESNQVLVRCAAPIYSIKEQISLPKTIPRCDLFWSPHYNVPLMPIRAKKRVVTIHDACHLAMKARLGWKERLYAEVMFRQAVSRSDAIVTDSQFSKNELCKFLSVREEKIQVIYPGVDAQKFSKQPTRQEREGLREKYALPEAFYLSVGNVKPHKNLAAILDVYERYDIEIPLVAIGKKSGLRTLDPAMQRIERDPRLRERVFLVDAVSDQELVCFYHMAVGLVFPSLYEGFGLPPLEAMAAGCPAVVSNRASLPEVCGDAALLVDPDRREELADGMRRIAREGGLRRELVEKGKVRAQSFSWKRTGREYAKKFEETFLS